MIQFHLYTLHSRGSLNAVSRRREFPGALIRVNDGVGCLHPWPEFGDAPIDEQLKLLRGGGVSQVIERALRMATVDGEARRSGVSLFAGLEIPPSHYSWDRNQPTAPQMQRVIREGWRAIKMKGSPGIEEVLRSVEDRSAGFSPPPSNARRTEADTPLWRVDFNACLTEERFRRFLLRMPLRVRERLDFIEDPFPYTAEAWGLARRELRVRLACDKGLARTAGAVAGTPAFDVAVMKPGRREWRGSVTALPSDVGVVMTSAMDHAVGQSFAAYEAGLAWRELGNRMDLCGLCTEHLFEKDAFFERMNSHGGRLDADSGGTGLGFDEVLAKLPWRRL